MTDFPEADVPVPDRVEPAPDEPVPQPTPPAPEPPGAPDTPAPEPTPPTPPAPTPPAPQQPVVAAPLDTAALDTALSELGAAADADAELLALAGALEAFAGTLRAMLAGATGASMRSHHTKARRVAPGPGGGRAITGQAGGGASAALNAADGTLIAAVTLESGRG